MLKQTEEIYSLGENQQQKYLKKRNDITAKNQNEIVKRTWARVNSVFGNSKKTNSGNGKILWNPISGMAKKGEKIKVGSFYAP